MKGINILDFHWAEQPWFNTVDYTVLQVILFTIGALLWVVAYICTLFNAYKRKNKKTLDIPVIAVVLNFGSEITTAFFWLPNMGKFLVLAYWAWMVLDIFIVIAMFRYGYLQFPHGIFKNNKKNLNRILFPAIVMSFLLQVFFILRYDVAMAPVDNFIINLVMSICFINLIYVPGFTGNSTRVAWSKFLGTGIISVMFYTKYPENNFLTALYICCAVFDILYIYLLHKKENRAALTA